MRKINENEKVGRELENKRRTHPESDGKCESGRGDAVEYTLNPRKVRRTRTTGSNKERIAG